MGRFLRNKHCRVISTAIIGLIFFSCAPSVNIVRSYKKYPPREDSDTVVFYKKSQDVPIKSEIIGKLETICGTLQKGCDSVSIFSLAETKIKKAGGNAFLVTTYQKPTIWNGSKLQLNGDVLFVSDFFSPPDTLTDLMKKHRLYFGFGIGPETGISLMTPKISYYNFQDRKILSTYYGIEGAINLIIAPWFALDCLYGVKKNIFTFDTSVGVWWLPKTKLGDGYVDPYFHTTLNPKIGVKFGKVWLKAGPSMHLYRKGERVSLGKIGKRYYNFEILIAAW